MKAAVFYGKEHLAVENIEKPMVREKEVLVQVMACGICGTDVHIFHGDEGAAPTPSGTALGHEFSGVITEVGKDIQNLKVGDRVCVDPNVLCGKCYFCRNAIGHFCEDMIGIGTTVNGGFAEYCVVPQSQVYKIADTTSFEEAAMAEPLSCCIHGIDLCDIRDDDVVMVIGCGMIGMLMLQLAKKKGAAKVIVLEPEEEKRNRAKKLGADLCLNPLQEDVKAVLQKEGEKRITKVIECVGSAATMEQAVSYAGQKAIVMFFGLTSPATKISLAPYEVFRKELEIKASYINPYTMQRAIGMINDKSIDVSSMIHRVCGIDELPDLLANPASLRKGKVIIAPNQECKS